MSSRRPPKQQHGLSIKGPELRWLFRHRNRPEVQHLVRFWLPDREVPQDELFSRPECNQDNPTRTYGSWTWPTARAPPPASAPRSPRRAAR